MSYRVKIDKRTGDKSSISRDGESLSETVYITASQSIGRHNLPQFIAALVLIHVKSNKGKASDINDALSGLLDTHLSDNSKARLDVSGTFSAPLRDERYSA